MTRILNGRFFSLCLIGFLLIPCVSFTDDLILLRSLSLNFSTQDDSVSAKQDPTVYSPESLLERLLQELDHLQLSSRYSLAIAICITFLTASPALAEAVRDIPANGGRSPPRIH